MKKRTQILMVKCNQYDSYMFIPPNQHGDLSPLTHAEAKIYKFVAFVNISWLTILIFHRIQPDVCGIFFTREIYVYKCRQRGQFNHYLMLNKSLKYFVAFVHNQKITRINFQTKVTNVPWIFSNGLPQGTLFKQAPLS